MALVAHVADSHFDQAPGGRFDECVKVHDWIADDIQRRGVGLVLHAGDVYERSSTPDERLAVAAWVRKVAKTAPVVLVRGNHDRLRDLEILERLNTRHPVKVVEGAEVLERAGVVIGCLGWPSRAGVMAMAAERGLGHEGAELLAGEALRGVLRGLGQQMALLNGPRILLAHAMVRGATVSTGQPLVGCDLELGTEDLRLAEADFYVVGHIHKGQAWCGEAGSIMQCDVGDIVYPGSPRRTSFGEVEAKGYVIYDTETRTWERIETPCTPMLLLETFWMRGAGDEPGGFANTKSWGGGPDVEDVRGAEIRFRYTVDVDQREIARARAQELRDRWLADGAVLVKVEDEARSSVKAKSPEIAAAQTLPDKLRAYWAMPGRSVDTARQAPLLSKLERIESEVRA
jgi:exonuclease SbcD